MLLRVISQCAPPPLVATFKKGLPLPFSLAKKGIYLGTQLKEDLTYLLLKLPRRRIA